ncbi:MULTISPECIES: hypothetical protein [unclassified Streptomyces]|uniref:hypothetical protein n=1 Tax=unclassified Streptomyces TaxID=2593676 RepID=UPI00308D6E25|nr:hypothetical protein OIE54_04915 [Streptomyces sp. NBC_01794]
MSGAGFRFGAERMYPMRRAGPDPRFSESLVNSVAALLVGYGYPPFAAPDDWAALESALAAFLYQPKET